MNAMKQATFSVCAVACSKHLGAGVVLLEMSLHAWVTGGHLHPNRCLPHVCSFHRAAGCLGG
jgi:hypothetical protein